MSRVFIAGILLAALAVIGVSCGGGGSTTAGAGTSTKAEFIKQGDKICAKREAEKIAALQKAFAKRAESKTTLDKSGEEELVTSVALPPIKKMTEELAQLDLPRGEEARAEAIVAGFEEALATVESEPGSVLSGGSEPLAAPDKLAEKYGFTACAEI